MGDCESGRSFGSLEQCGLPLAGPAKGRQRVCTPGEVGTVSSVPLAGGQRERGKEGKIEGEWLKENRKSRGAAQS